MPVLYDNCLQVSVSFLKRYGYLNPNQWKNGTITWSRGEAEHKEITAQISISVNTCIEPYLELNYKQNDKPVNYRVRLVSVPSNIGRGVVWFFICPNTRRRCRKIYLIGEKFLHREAFRGCMYKVQTYSKCWRREKKIFDLLLLREDIITEMDKPYFKDRYNGEPTKRFQKIVKLAKEICEISL